jgi:hypothetical protein
MFLNFPQLVSFQLYLPLPLLPAVLLDRNLIT